MEGTNDHVCGFAKFVFNGCCPRTDATTTFDRVIAIDDQADANTFVVMWKAWKPDRKGDGDAKHIR